MNQTLNMSQIPNLLQSNVSPTLSMLGSPRKELDNDHAFIKTELEKEYNLRLSQLKSMYEMRIQSFQETLKTIFLSVQKDELLDTMKQDEASEEFLNQRVREIIDECMYNDREVMIEKLSYQYTHLKVELSRTDQENIRVLYISI